MATINNDERPLRILFVSAGVYPPDFGGGQLRVHRTFLRQKELFGDRLDVEVLAKSGKLTTAGIDEVDGITVHRLAASANALASSYQAAAFIWQRHRQRRIDLVYTLTTGRLVYWSGFVAGLLKLPTVVEFINNDIEETAIRRAFAGRLCRGATLSIAISEPLGRQFERLGVPRDRVWVRPNPVNTAKFSLPDPSQRERARARVGARPEHTVHLIAGSISPRKNQILGVDALERLGPAHRLVIVGPVLPQNEPYAATLEQRIARSPRLSDITLIRGFVDDMETFMHAADCLWLPSFEEGLGNVMLEALCCGVPCVINRDLGMSEHIQSGRNGYEAAPDPDAWASAVDAVAALIGDGERRATISETACARYDSRAFDRECYQRLRQAAFASGVVPPSPPAA